MSTNLERRTRIKAHIRHKVTGTAQKPRMTVFRSNTQIYAQLIDDVTGVTLAAASSLGLKEKATKTSVRELHRTPAKKENGGPKRAIHYILPTPTFLTDKYCQLF